jgi:hypothetical protein
MSGTLARVLVLAGFSFASTVDCDQRPDATVSKWGIDPIATHLCLLETVWPSTGAVIVAVVVVSGKWPRRYLCRTRTQVGVVYLSENCPGTRAVQAATHRISNNNNNGHVRSYNTARAEPSTPSSSLPLTPTKLSFNSGHRQNLP